MAVVAPPRGSAEPEGRPSAAPAPTEAELRGYKPDGRLKYIPALDGLRGLGIPFVLLYHNDAPLFGIQFRGGFLTVSMFFTLSGYLITRLLIYELDKSGTINIKLFYQRRFRRLMPAALAVLALVAIFWAVFPTGHNLSYGSYLSALFYSQNLYLRFHHLDYNNLFLERSPLQHMWSLSLEEQIYLVFPVALVGLTFVRKAREHFDAVLAGAAVVSFAIGGIYAARSGNNSAYYATEARAGEFLLGAAAAAYWLKGRYVPKVAALLKSPTGQAISFLVLAIDVVLWWNVDLSTSWMFPWGLALNASLVCLLMAYGTLESGCAGLLSIAPLAAMGRVVYGLYLVHWPVFLFITPEAVHVRPEILFAIRVAVTVAITLAIFFLIEDPVRRGRKWHGRRFAEACLLLALLGLVIAPFAKQPSAAAAVDTAAVALQQEALASLPVLPPNAPTHSTVDPALPARVLVVGDSQSWVVGSGMKDLWGQQHGVTIEPSAGVGCGTTAITPIRYLGQELDHGELGCREWRAALPKILTRFQPQLVIVVGSLADVSDHHIDGKWEHIGMPAYDAWLAVQMRAFADELGSHGAHVLWMTLSDVKLVKPPGVSSYAEEDPARVARYNALIDRLAAGDPAVDAADLAGFVKARPGGEFNAKLRPDGAHFDMQAAPDIVAWIGDQIRLVSAGH